MKTIENMLSIDVIEPIRIKLSSPIVFLPKKDGTFRFFLVYRKPSSMWIQDSCSILGMDENIDYLSDVTIFSTFPAYSIKWEGRNRQEVSGQDGIHLPPRPIFNYTNGNQTEARPRDDSARDEYPTDRGEMTFCLGSYRRYRNIFQNARGAYGPCSTSAEVSEQRRCID